MPEIEQSLRQFTEALRDRLGAIEPPRHVRVGLDCSSYIRMVLSPMDAEEVAGALVATIGEDKLKAFYKGYISKNPPPAVCISSYLFDAVPQFCSIAEGPKIVLDSDGLVECLREYLAIVHQGDMPIRVSLRLANVDIATEFELAPGVWLQRNTEDLIRRKYPVDRSFIGVSEVVARSWFDHLVEAVFESRGRGRELDVLHQHEVQDSYVNSIVDAFLLAGLQDSYFATVTHFRYDTPLRSFGYTRDVDRVRHEAKLLGETELEKLKSTYAFLQQARSDTVLLTAIDRFLLGRRSPNHHPLNTNQPNWDKIVDYVIAMESLFLTDGEAELSYRLALNGSSLVHLATGADRRAVFNGLKVVYGLRSKIVHGKSADLSHLAKKFLEAIGQRLLNPNDRLQSYQKVRAQCEAWLTSVILYLGAMPLSKRPYRRPGGWEDILWPDASLMPNCLTNDFY